MLKRLHIRNYLLLEELEFDIDKGLTIITGETGSGKSILIGALGLAMGERAEAQTARDPQQRCVVELEIDLGNLDLEEWFASNELPWERFTLLRRQLDPGGRSRAFVNDTPVRLEQLREIAARLIHVHSQHHTLLLNDSRFQLGLLDHVAGTVKVVKEYAAGYRKWVQHVHELEQLRAMEMRSRAELDLLLFRANELDQAALKPGEQERLELELSRAENGQELISSLQGVEEMITADQGVLALLNRSKQALQRAAKLDPAAGAVLARLVAAHIELKDIGEEAGALASQVEVDPATAARSRERMDLILHLQQKHHVRSVEELLALQSELQDRVGTIGSLGDRIREVEASEKALSAAVLDQARTMSRLRTKAVKSLADQVEAMLQELGMPHAVFQFEHRTGSPGPTGIDSIRALFSAQGDRAPAPLDKVASGGELSRVMLALISLAADSQGLPTVVFDEIDTGVSGEVADRVGELLARMGRQRQVLAITHLPQIASKGHTHLLVSKNVHDGVAQSSILPLDQEARVLALAQMLSGKRTTKTALEHARVLLKGN